MKKRLLSIIICSSMIITLLVGCGKTAETYDEPIIVETVENQEEEKTIVEETPVVEEVEEVELTGDTVTIADIKNKYGSLDNKHIKPFYNVAQTTEFTFPFKSKVEPCLAVTVHTDPKCEDSSTVYQINDAYDNGSGYDIVVKPGSPVLNANDRADGKLSNYNWGNAPVYYLCIRYDMEADTPIKLAEPIVVPFTIKREVSTPNLTCEVDTDGTFKLKWNKVDGAVSYNIYQAFEVRSDSAARGKTRSECGYVGDHLQKIINIDGDILEFKDFNFDGTDNTLKDNNGYIYNQNFYDLNTYYVTAVDANGNESSFSMAVEGWKYSSQLPETFDKYTVFFKNTDGKVTYLPETVPVQMVDNSVAYLPINYTKIGDGDYGAKYLYSIVGTKLQGEVEYYRVDKEYPEEIKSLANVSYSMYEIENSINIIPENTVNTIVNSEYVDLGQYIERDNSKKLSYDRNVLVARADLENARMIQDGVYPEGKGPSSMLDLGGLVEYIDLTSDIDEDRPSEPIDETITEEQPTVVVEEEPQVDEEQPQVGNTDIETTPENFVEQQIDETNKEVEEGNNQPVLVSNVKVFADSAEEEYLALKMAACETTIDISAFPQLQNMEYLMDVLLKVIYQNPYVMGVTYCNYDPNTVSVIIEYEISAEDVARQQQEVKAEAEKIVSQCITDGMSDEEKVMAIWNYLETNTVYDNAACDAAKANDFKDVTGFENAFTSYGIMCKKVGVCQSYAYCNKILLDLCGVECHTLTGFLNKTLPHAWNVVKLDGAWYWVDTTNNLTNSGVPYMIYQSSSDFSLSIDYVLDNDYNLDNNLLYVINNDNNKDWYSKNNLFASSDDDIAQIIAINYVNSDDMICVKCKTPPVMDDVFVSDLFQELLGIGASPEKLQQCRFGYTNGLFIFMKGQ